MSDKHLIISRRRLLGAGALGAGGLILSGCDKLNSSPGFRSLLESADSLHLGSQRLIGREALAREYSVESRRRRGRRADIP